MSLLASMTETLLLQQGSPEANILHAELEVAHRRKKLLGTVLTWSEEALAAMIDGVTDEGKGDGEASQSLGSLARAGPCNGYENLRAIGELRNLQRQLRVATTTDEVKQRLDASAPLRRLYTTLTNSCKTAVGDVDKALKLHLAEQEDKNKALKETARRQVDDAAKNNRGGKH